MASLNAHLRSGPLTHGRLGFHPSCPRCRTQRLSGGLGADAVVGRRASATLVAGVLAFTANSPAALAQGVDGDQGHEGTVEPGVDPPGLEPGFDPGGDDGFDVDAAPAPSVPGGGEDDDGEGAPVEVEPLTDPNAVVLPEDTAPEPEQAAPPVSPAPQPTPPTTTQPPPAAATLPTAAPPVAPPVAESAPPAVEQDEPTKRIERHGGRRASHGHRRRHTAPPSPAVQDAPPPDTTIDPSTQAAPPQTPVVAAAPTRRAGEPITGDRYTVRAGDSLWSIAHRVLGAHATIGQIAREVHRLWQLNEQRIGTGDEDLILPGTALRLR